MTGFPKKCILDTNVPKTANRALDSTSIPQGFRPCVLACIEAVEHVVKKGGLVLDSNDEIFTEYRNNLSLSGQPGVGDLFMKWVHDTHWRLPESDRVKITANGASYDEFPEHMGLRNFDNSDRKFVAVANAHPAKPPILQATDSKWWGWKTALQEVKITVHFICRDFIKAKYSEKMENER
ncbi:MAG: hypothetical protein DRJ14_01685 [Acidobacteria bacterium]|nr:MAG: hypothetical protein DRJ14_01685 [Acidobacteriota bacterium]